MHLRFERTGQTYGGNDIFISVLPKIEDLRSHEVDSKALLAVYNHMIHCHFRAGTIGCSANVSNTVAAVFIATGQDVGSVVESSTSQLILAPSTEQQMEQAMRALAYPAGCQSEGGIYACLVMPSLIVGTVGGGTGLATQRECLQLMGCYGIGGVSRLAEIISGFALGLELSTIAAITSGQFVSAHEKLGRKRPQSGLMDHHVVPELFSGLMGDEWTFVSSTPVPVSNDESILTELSKMEKSKKVGHFGFDVLYQAKDSGIQKKVKMVLKAKPTDVEACSMVNKLAQRCGHQLAVNYERHNMQTGFRYTHVREVELFRLDNKSFKRFLPHVYQVLYDPSKEIHAILMEYLDKSNVCLLNCADDITEWKTEDIKVVLRDMAHIHALFLNQQEWLFSQEWLEHMSANKMAAMSPLWRELLNHAHKKFPEVLTSQRAAIVDAAIHNIPTIWNALQPLPHTLTHNDFNPRNLCLRLAPPLTEPSSQLSSLQSLCVPYQDPRHLCIYDWELARINVPQHDLIQFLTFVLHPPVSKKTMLEFVDFYRLHLEHYSQHAFPMESFVMGFNMACLDYAMNRLLLHMMVHTSKDCKYLPRVTGALFSYLEAELAGRPLTHLFDNSV